jgi:hypothetical protein
MNLEEKKKIEKILIKIASLHNPEVPPDLIKKHVVQHIDILDKHIDKYGVITHDSIKDIHAELSRLHRLNPPMPPIHLEERLCRERGLVDSMSGWGEKIVHVLVHGEATIDVLAGRKTKEDIMEEALDILMGAARKEATESVYSASAIVEATIAMHAGRKTKEDIMKEAFGIFMGAARKEATESVYSASAIGEATIAMHARRKTVEIKEAATNVIDTIPVKVPYKPFTTAPNVNDISFCSLHRGLFPEAQS